jgi:hypothetical protein
VGLPGTFNLAYPPAVIIGKLSGFVAMSGVFPPLRARTAMASESAKSVS